MRGSGCACIDLQFYVFRFAQLLRGKCGWRYGTNMALIELARGQVCQVEMRAEKQVTFH
jgi:hypothetical protein